MNTTAQTIGQMNGRWGLGFRLMIATYPVLLTALIGWGAFITNKVLAHDAQLNTAHALNAFRTEASEARQERYADAAIRDSLEPVLLSITLIRDSIQKIERSVTRLEILEEERRHAP